MPKRANIMRYPSTYIALVVWGTTGFMAQPTFASFVVHFLAVPVALATTIVISHWEGRRDGELEEAANAAPVHSHDDKQ
jgi:hypothetical protein